MSKLYRNQDNLKVSRLLSVITNEDESLLAENIHKRGLIHFMTEIDSFGYPAETVEKVRSLFELAQIILKEELHDE